MEYNLVRNAQLGYSITDGHNNRILSEDEVSYIDDNDTSFENSILVSGTEYLIFETSFNRRIKIDKVKLYLYSTTTSGITLDHLNFYYSNDNELDYEIITDKFAGDNNFYYVELPFPSAPMKVKVTVSGLDCSISEYFISNDDYPIGFGKDGDLSKIYITRTDDNDRTNVQQLAIYNRNTNSLNNLVSAYICVDYTGELGDNYLKISDNADSGFIGIEDNIIIEDNLLNNDYIWDMGIFNKTKITNNELVLDLDEMRYVKGEIPHPDTNDQFLDWSSNSFVSDEINNILYILVPDYYLKLYKYSYFDDAWEFIGKINPGCTDFEFKYSLAKIDNYIYVLLNSSCEFGRYDLDGVENNWEVLETPPTHTPMISEDAFSICGDTNEYVYFISLRYNTSSTPTTFPDSSFARYSVISGSVSGWEPLANDYSVEQTHPTIKRCNLGYNKEESCLYLSGGAYYLLKYIQRYDIATNDWDNEWFYINHYIDTMYNFSYCYKYPFIYILNDDHLYSYDIIYYTFITLVKWGNSTYYDPSHSSNIIVVDSPVWRNKKQIIFTGVGEEYYDHDNMLWYNGFSSEGDYTTPVLDVVDSYKSSYFLIDYELQQHTLLTNAKFEDFKVMQLRSSDIPLLPIERVYYIDVGNFSTVNLYTDSTTESIPNQPVYMNADNFFAYAINNKTGEVCASYIKSTLYYIVIFNYDGTAKIEIHDEETYTSKFRLTTIKFDSEGGIYGYDEDALLFVHRDSSLNLISSQSGETKGVWTQDGVKYVKDFCVGEDRTVWYIHEGLNELIHCDMYFNELNSMVLSSPYTLKSDSEGGVWVVYSDRMKIIRYNKYYNIELTFSFNEPVSDISPDKDGGLWVTQDITLTYFSKDSTIVKNFASSISSTWICAGYQSCFLYSNPLKTGYLFRYSDGLVKEVTFDETQFLPPLFFCHTYEDTIMGKTDYLPVDYDPNWGINGTIEWDTVQVNGYYLSKNKYHQLKITLKTGNTDNTPKVKKIKIAPCIKLVDIQKNTYKSIYLKLDVPDQFKNQTYDTKIKCWWEDKE